MFKSEQEIEEESKRIKKRTFTGLLKMYSILFLIVFYIVYLHPNTLVEQTSPSGEKEVIVKSHGTGLLGGFVTIVIKKDGFTVKRKIVNVGRGGKSHHRERFNIAWRYDENVVSVFMDFGNPSKRLVYNYETLDLEIE